ncbi:AMP-binding protein [Prauserella flavalba]|uniref:AMP-binding protein n=1 Tax=Prauserella flavalba TaxID=1477506 RepID=UPI0036E920B1
MTDNKTCTRPEAYHTQTTPNRLKLKLVASLAGNSVEFLPLLLAAGMLGAIAVPVNSRLSYPEVGYVFSDSDPTVFVVPQRSGELTAPDP